MSLQIEKKWIGEEAIDGDKVKILYGQSLKGLDVNGNEVEIIKIDASGDAVVPQGVVASEGFVNSEIASEAALRMSGDADTLASSQSYTDAEVLEEKELREAEDLLMFKKDGSRLMTGNINMGGGSVGPRTRIASGLSVMAGVLQPGINFSSLLDNGFNKLTESLKLQKVVSGVATDIAIWSEGMWSFVDSNEVEVTSEPATTGAFSFTTTFTGSLNFVFIEQVAAGLKIVNLANGNSGTDAANYGQVLSVAFTVTNLQNEVNTTQTGAGLSPLGAYVPHEMSSYLGSATSLSHADLVLDAAITTVNNDLLSAISTEQALREQEQSSLYNLITQEISDRTIALQAEEARAIGVEGSLQSQIDTEKNRVDAILSASDADKDSFAEIVTLINSVNTENDSSFAGYVLSNNAAVAQLNSDLLSKESALIAADEALDARLDILEADPVTKTYVDSEIESEEIARIAGDASTLSFAQSYSDGIVATEASARISGDASTLASANLHSDDIVATEAFARVAGDETTLASAESYTDAEVLIEKNRAEAAEGMLGMRVLFLEGKTLSEDLMFEVGANSVGVNSVTLPHMASGIYKVCVGRLNVFKNVDYTVGTEMTIVDGIPSPKTKLTWIGELASGGSSPISSGDKIFISYLYNA